MNLLLFNLKVDEKDPVLAFAVDWINNLAKRVNRIIVVTMEVGEAELADNVEVHSVGKEKGYSELRRVFEFYRILFRILRNKQIDACFAHMMPLFVVLGAPLLIWYRVPVILWYAHKSVTFILRVSEKVVDRIITASQESFRIESDKVIITGHGVNVNRFEPRIDNSVSETFLITSVGRISPVKRLENLIEVAYRLREEGLNFKVRIVGGGRHSRDYEYLNELKERVYGYDLQHLVHFAGTVPFNEVAEEYRKADLVVNLSDTGSVDKAVLEAMSCKTLVATSNESFRSILSPLNENLFIPNNDPPSIFERIISLAGLSQEIRKEIEDELRSIVLENHSLDMLSDRVYSEASKLSSG